MAVGDANIFIDNGKKYKLIGGVLTVDDVSGSIFVPKTHLGFHLVGQSFLDHKQKQREVVEYIERDGEETGSQLIDSSIATGTVRYPREAFDYELQFVYFTKNTYDFEAKIDMLLKVLNEGGTNPNGATKDKLIIRNEYTNTNMVGYFKDIKINSYERKKYTYPKEYMEFSVIFRIPKPSRCTF